MKIGVAMSGGLDSTVTAAMLQEQGHRVTGYFMLLPVPHPEDVHDRARRAAAHLGIPLHEVDMRQRFSDRVIRPFVETYGAGRTPNPCARCNPLIKFGALRLRILGDGNEKMATGHYARLTMEGPTPQLRRGVDSGKDQSYFLGRLSSEELADVLLPLGDFTKEQVRNWARRRHLPGGEADESQDVCFLAGRSLATFLGEHGLDDEEGEVITADGRVIGRHRGIFRYTIGQRRGLGLPDITPWYVKELNARRNRVVVCKKEDLFSRRLYLTRMHYTGRPLKFPWQGRVQIRSRHPAAGATVTVTGRDSCRVLFAEPQPAITPGQLAVLYDDDRVVGSGEIDDHHECQ